MNLIYSYTWGVGGGLINDTHSKGRSKFSGNMKNKFQSFYPQLPLEGELFDYYCDWKAIRLKPWSDIID